MLAHYATYLVRGARWRRSIRHLQSATGYLRFGLLVFFYNFVDNVVPAKLGDLYGAHLARINLGVRRSAALGSIVFQRMIDSWVVVALAAIGATFVFSGGSADLRRLGPGLRRGAWRWPPAALLVVFAVLKKIPTLRLPEVVESRLVAFQAGMWPRSRELATIAAHDDRHLGPGGRLDPAALPRLRPRPGPRRAARRDHDPARSPRPSP